MLIERYCSCGAVLRVNVPRRKRQQVLIVWADRHHGPGHAETDAAAQNAALIRDIACDLAELSGIAAHILREASHGS